jgi:hypothetical protein
LFRNPFSGYESTAHAIACRSAFHGEVALADPDPLLALLQRYRSERKAFDEDDIPNEEFDGLARNTWHRTQSEILDQRPSADTAAGALLALDYVLESEELFGDRSESDDLELLRFLIEAARDYIKARSVSG